MDYYLIPTRHPLIKRLKYNNFYCWFFTFPLATCNIKKKLKKRSIFYCGLWVFSLWIGVILIGEELVSSSDKLWAICFLLFFHGVRGVMWVVGLFVVSGWLMACHSHYLFSGKGLVVRYMIYCNVVITW